jgi:magnesium transporter
MLNVLRRGHAAFQQETPGPGWRPGDDVIWIDLLRPTREEELAVESALGLELPTIEEMEALEPSSRLYQESGATFMTATLLAHGDELMPLATPATFVLAQGRLITLRYEQLRAYAVYSVRAHSLDATTGVAALLGLLDAIVERLAQVLDASADRVEAASQAVFKRPPGGDFRPLLTGLAAAQSVTALVRASLVSLARLVSYAALATEVAADPECRAPPRFTAARRPVADRPRRAPVGTHHLPARCGPGSDQHRAEQHHQGLLGGGARVHPTHAHRLDLRA